MRDQKQQKIAINNLDLHRRFKAHCRERGVRMVDVVQRFMAEELHRAKPSTHINAVATPDEISKAIAGPPFWERGKS